MSKVETTEERKPSRAVQFVKRAESSLNSKSKVPTTPASRAKSEVDGKKGSQVNGEQESTLNVESRKQSEAPKLGKTLQSKKTPERSELAKKELSHRVRTDIHSRLDDEHYRRRKSDRGISRNS